MTYISIISPVFNEGEGLRTFIQEVRKTMDSCEVDYELILVNDGSTDQTPEIIREMIKAHARIRSVFLARNFGQQAAYSAGLSVATGQAVILMDSDLQDPPEVIPQLIKCWRDGYEIVTVVRAARKEALWLRICYKAFYRLANMLGETPNALDCGDFGLLDARIARVLQGFPEKRKFIRGLRSWIGFRSTSIVIERPARPFGHSKYNLRKLTALAFDGLIDFSILPLRFAIVAGLVMSVCSVLLGIFFIAHRLIGFHVLNSTPAANPGIATAIIAVSFLSGTILLVLGIIGEYIGRIFWEVKGRPAFVIDEIINFKESDQSQNWAMNASDKKQGAIKYS